MGWREESAGPGISESRAYDVGNDCESMSLGDSTPGVVTRPQGDTRGKGLEK